jgi:phage terminase large subunit-like protein
MIPTPRQAEFLELTCKEALYGGAAGGGKSEALEIWLAEGVHIPDYSAVVFRRTYPQLLGNDGLIQKAKNIYPAMGGKWNAQIKAYVWPNGATIKFSHLQHEKSVDDHQGPSYHRVAFDEITQFTEYQYLYLLGRIRKAPDFPIYTGIRVAGNPGGEGHLWVKRRFVTQAAMTDLQGMDVRAQSKKGQIYWHQGRAFVPARLPDNPHLDIEDYIENLSHLPPVTRARMLNGDWSVAEGAILSHEWWRDYAEKEGNLLPMDKNGKTICEIPEKSCKRFLCLDTAGSVEREEENRGKNKSYHALGVFDYSEQNGKFLFLRHVWRGQCEYPDLRQMVTRIYNTWNANCLYVEDATMGRALGQELRKNRMTVHLLSAFVKAERSRVGDNTRPGKIERSVDLQRMMEKGQIFFPQYDNQWLPDYEAELLSWRGLKEDQDDQVDITSYAARIVAGKGIKLQTAPNVRPFNMGRVRTLKYTSKGYR